MLEITLEIEGKQKKFVEPKVNLRHMKECASYLTRIEEDLLTTNEAFDEAINLICDIFKDENVNYENVSESICPDDFNVKIMDIIFKVVDGETRKKGKSTRLTMMQKAEKEALKAMDKEVQALSKTT